MKKSTDYQPSDKVLEKYADVIVNFALGGGKGIKRGDTVYLIAPEYSKPLMIELRKAIFKAGGNVILSYQPNNNDRYNADKDFFTYADDKQLSFFPEKFMKGIVDECDHSIYLLSDANPQALKGINPEKIMKRGVAFKPYTQWRTEKENQGKFTWCIALYGTPAMAKEAGLSLKEFWDQTIKACFLDKANPIKEWQKVFKQVDQFKQKLDKLKIEKVHLEGPDINLWVQIGANRQWLAGSGRNIPSFEVFTSPDWRGTNGWVKFNQPLYAYGNIVEGIELEFKDGIVVKSKARKNEKVLKSMLASPNANKVGEFSLTDKRLSRITKFMANTLFDENIGGPHGNTHIALGKAYQDAFAGNIKKLSAKDFEKLGFNDSPVHTDIISTAPRTVTAYFKNGSNKIIYKNGQFTL